MGDKKSLKICHLYPDLLNLYSDRGNITALKNRLMWRGIQADIKEYKLRDDVDFNDADVVFLGGGSDREQCLVCERLKEQQDNFKRYVESGGTVVAVCGGYQLLGKYYKLRNNTIEGISVLDIYTEAGNSRLIGNIVIKSEIEGKTFNIVGFENHGGRTFIGNHTPLGKVVYGYGNNGKDGAEGVLYKNVFATYIHGPLLPKNPQLTDEILKRALDRKYSEHIELKALDDEIENAANKYVVKRFGKR